MSAAARTPGPEKLIDALVSRLSARTVRRLFPQDSHIPELAQNTRSAFAKLPAWDGEASQKPPRPPLLLAKPEGLAVMAEIPEGPSPLHLAARRRRVVKQGPSASPEWWRTLAKAHGSARDYYRIEDEDGCRYWVFAKDSIEPGRRSPRWFLHGVFP